MGEAPEWMQKIGMIGKEFSLSFKNIKIHKGKDNDHALTIDEWLKLPQAIKNHLLLLVTKMQRTDLDFI